VDEAMFVKLVQVFCGEVEKLCGTREDEVQESTGGFGSVFGRKTKAQQREERHLYFLQVLRLLCKVSPHLVSAFVQHGGLLSLRDLVIDPPCQTKVTEAAGSLLLDLFSDFPDDTLTQENIMGGFLTQDDVSGGTRAFRGLQIVHHLLKRWDMIPSTQYSSVRLKEQLLQCGAIEELLTRLETYHLSGETPPDATLVAYCALSMAVLGGCMRGCPAVRTYLHTSFGFERFLSLWIWVVRQMETVPFADCSEGSLDKQKKSPTSPLIQRVNSFDSQAMIEGTEVVNAWLGETMDTLLEIMCTGASFSLERQTAWGAVSGHETPMDGTPRAHTPKSPASEGMTRSASYSRLPSSQRLLQWHVPGVSWGGYPASLDFDVTSNATVLWRYVCAMSRCIMDGDAVLIVVNKLQSLPDQALRFLLILLLLLCRATPTNSYVFASSGCVDVLLRLIKDTYTRTHTTWQLSASIIMTVAGSHLTPSCINTVLQCMEHVASGTISNNIDVANVVLRAIPKYSVAQCYYAFDGMRGCLPVGVVEKWPSARTGYTLTITANASCVWQGGMTLVSIYEVATKEVVLALQYVPWHGSKFVAITTYSKQQRTTTVLRDRAVEDGWHKISLFHHRNGITVSVDGRKLEMCQSNLYPAKLCNIYLGALPYLQGDNKTEAGFTSFFFGKLSKMSIQEAAGGTTPFMLQVPWAEGPHPVGVEQFEFPKSSKTLLDLDVITKSCDHLLNPDVSAECKLLSLRLLAVLTQSDADGTAAFLASKGFEMLERFLDSPGAVTSDCVDAILEIASVGEKRVFRNDGEWPHLCLGIVLRVLHRPESLWPDPEEALLCRAATLRRLSEVLTIADNATVWRSGPGLTALLRLGLVLPRPYGAGIVAVMEKLCSSLADMELILAFAILNGTADITLQMLRMLFDVCKSTPATAKILAAGNPWNALLFLTRGAPASTTSELIRVQAIRILALLLHYAEKQRTLYLKGTGFDTLSAVIMPTPPTTCADFTIPTFDVLFQFALDSFQPTQENVPSEVSDLRYLAPPSTSPSSECAHTPSFIVVPSPVYTTIHRESILRSYNFVNTSGADEDEIHTTTSSHTIVYPQAIRLIFQMMPRSSPEIIKQVLQYLEKVISVPQNITAVLSMPWAEWLGPLIAAHGISHTYLRVVVRKLVAKDMCVSSKSCCIHRMRELADCPEVQLMIIEEFIVYLTSASRLDILDAAEVTAIMRNMETLFTIEEYLHPIPIPIALSIVHIIGAVAATSGAAIRTKMRSTKLFDIRDRLAFHVLFQGDTSADPVRIETLLSCCPRDPNACVLLLKLLVDGVQSGASLTPSLVTLVRTLSAEEDHRKVIQRLIVDADMMERLVSGQKEVADFVVWCSGGGLTVWGQVQSRVTKAYSTIENEMSSRAEKRQKGCVGRLKTRKGEEDKKSAAMLKAGKEDDDRRAESLGWGKERSQTIVDAALQLASSQNAAPTTTEEVQ
jgi:hypothetical protein